MLVAERGASTNTLEAYQRDLESLAIFANSIGLSDLEKNDLETYFAGLSQQGLSPRSQARRLSAIRQFYAFLVNEGVIRQDPSALLQTPRISRSLPKTLSQDGLHRLLTHVLKDETPRGKRLQLMLELLYGSGLRVSELVTLRLAAFHYTKTGEVSTLEPYLFIQGKGGKERLVPLSHAAIRAVGVYLHCRAYFLGKQKDAPWLFPSRSKEGHITRQQFGHLLKDAARAAGLNASSISPHILRHSFASHMLDGGADLRVIQELLGHTDITTTQIYTHVADKRLREVVEAHHPLTKERVED